MLGLPRAHGWHTDKSFPRDVKHNDKCRVFHFIVRLYCKSAPLDKLNDFLFQGAVCILAPLQALL